MMFSAVRFERVCFFPSFSALASTMDMFVTALELAGGSLPTDRTYDGRR
jgi:hypothetical protein